MPNGTRRTEVDPDYERRYHEHMSRFNATYGQIIAANRGMGRLLAKLDPQYAQDELDPDRKRKSDDIADQVIRKLIAEHVESNKLSGNN